MYYSVFIHSLFEWHPGCFKVMKITNKAALNTAVQVVV